MIPPGLERIVEHAAHKRERRGPFGDAKVALDPLTEQEADALDGLPWPGRRRTFISGDTPTIGLLRFEAALEAGGLHPDLLYAEVLGRPVRDLPGENRARRASRGAFAEAVLADSRVRERPALQAWLDAACAAGHLGPSDADALDAALQVVARLTPAGPIDALQGVQRPVDRAVLSAELFDGRPHALDGDTRLERLTRSLIGAWAGIDSAARPRSVWDACGVEVDATSTVVLTLNLAPRGDQSLERALRAQSGRHVVLTLGQLRRGSARWPAGDVFVCENPSVLRAAERALGERCPPLVCGSGWPTDAVRELLEQLRCAGATLLYHGDFDLAGIAIFRLLERDAGVRPWCYDVEAYGRALTACGHRDLPRVSAPRPAAGDLERALQTSGHEIPEELLLDELLGSLSRAFDGLRPPSVDERDMPADAGVSALCGLRSLRPGAP